LCGLTKKFRTHSSIVRIQGFIRSDLAATMYILGGFRRYKYKSSIVKARVLGFEENVAA